MIMPDVRFWAFVAVPIYQIEAQVLCVPSCCSNHAVLYGGPSALSGTKMLRTKLWGQWVLLCTCIRCGVILNFQIVVEISSCRVLTYCHLHNSLEIALSVGRIDEGELSDKAPPLYIQHVSPEDREPSMRWKVPSLTCCRVRLWQIWLRLWLQVLLVYTA